MDVEGAEWAQLEALLANPAACDRIRTIDLEIHVYLGNPDQSLLEKRVELLEHLGNVFTVTGHTLRKWALERHGNIQVAREKQDLQAEPKIYTSDGFDITQFDVSYVHP